MEKPIQNKVSTDYQFGLGEALDTLYKMATGFEPDRSDVLRYEKDDLIIDTCEAYDTGEWETGLHDKRYSDRWIIIEQYPDRKSALKGQEKWVKIFTGSDLPEEIDDVLIDKTYKLK